MKLFSEIGCEMNEFVNQDVRSNDIHGEQQEVGNLPPAQSNCQQSPAGPVNMRRNMGRCWPIVGAAKVNCGWKLGPFIMTSVNHSAATSRKTITELVVSI